MHKQITNVQTGETQTVPLTDQEILEKQAEIAAFERDVLPGILLDNLRRERNRLLVETDYLALADATLTDEMRTYRQALRDLPANTADPANPVWPTKP